MNYRQAKVGWPRIGKWPLFYIIWSHETGSGFFRIFGYGLALKAPWWPPLFGEQHGFHKPLIRIRGWRVFPLRPA